MLAPRCFRSASRLPRSKPSFAVYLASMLAGAAAAQGATTEPPAPAQNPAEADLRFDILEYQIDGNSVLPVMVIEQTVTPFLGLGRSMLDVEGARAALEKAYQSAGFLTVFVDVPEQRVDSGVVRLAVIEGRIERLRVSGSRYFSQGWIRAKVPEFSEGAVPNFTAAQRQLAVVNRSEERRVQPVLRPGRAPGTVEVELKVSDELPLSGSVELHNQHAADTDALRLAASLRYDNLFQRDHSLTLNAITAPREPRQSQALVANYTVPLDSGNSIIGYGVASDSAVDTLGGTTVLGNGLTLGLRFSIPFVSTSGSGAHGFTFGVDYKDLEEEVQFGGGTIATPLRYLPFQMAYNGSWGEAGVQTQLSATFVAALRQVLQRTVDCPNGRADQFACKRQGADGGFSTLRSEWQHARPFWAGSSVALKLSGQWATQPLASSEQFAVGGAESVRGYLESAASGDRGVLGSAEWRSPNLGTRVSRWFGTPPPDSAHSGATEQDAPAAAPPALLSDFTLSAFVDVARVDTIDPAIGQAARVPVLGVGLGLRTALRRSLSAALDVAWPRKQLAAKPEDDGARWHARLGWRF